MSVCHILLVYRAGSFSRHFFWPHQGSGTVRRIAPVLDRICCIRAAASADKAGLSAHGTEQTAAENGQEQQDPADFMLPVYGDPDGRVYSFRPDRGVPGRVCGRPLLPESGAVSGFLRPAGCGNICVLGNPVRHAACTESTQAVCAVHGDLCSFRGGELYVLRQGLRVYLICPAI